MRWEPAGTAWSAGQPDASSGQLAPAHTPPASSRIQPIYVPRILFRNASVTTPATGFYILRVLQTLSNRSLPMPKRAPCYTCFRSLPHADGLRCSLATFRTLLSKAFRARCAADVRFAMNMSARGRVAMPSCAEPPRWSHSAQSSSKARSAVRADQHACQQDLRARWSVNSSGTTFPVGARGDSQRQALQLNFVQADRAGSIAVRAGARLFPSCVVILALPGIERRLAVRASDWSHCVVKPSLHVVGLNDCFPPTVA